MEGAEFMKWINGVSGGDLLIIYLLIIVAPFVQEDSAVWGAAALSVTGLGEPALIFILILIGLTVSDLWKYWLGRVGRTARWAAKFVQKPSIQTAEKIVKGGLCSALFAARFTPGARVALYLACGFFKASWKRFAIYVAISALAYIAIAFAVVLTGWELPRLLKVQP